MLLDYLDIVMKTALWIGLGILGAGFLINSYRLFRQRRAARAEDEAVYDEEGESERSSSA